MNRSRLYTAILFSALLISGAIWSRLTQTSTYTASIEPVNTTSFSAGESPPSTYKETSETSQENPTLSKPLSQTDLVSRQLFSEYAGMVSNGQTTSSNLNAVAEKYAASIVNLHQYTSANLKDLTIVENNNKNFQIYGDAVLAIRYKYMDLSAAQVKSSGIASLTDKNFPIFAKIIGQLYKTAAEELLVVKTPTSMATTHLELINSHLSSAQAMNVLSDPKISMESYAALSVLAENSDKADQVYSAVIDSLLKNGITYTMESIPKNNI